MKRIASSAAVAVVTVILGASSALAQTYPPTTPPLPTGGTNPPAPGPTAFTGSDVSFAVLAMVALLVVGLAALFAARRRAARVAG